VNPVNPVNPANLANPSHHEESDVNVAGVVVFVVVLVVVGVLISGAVWVLYRQFEQASSGPATVEFPLAMDAMRRLPPQPRLQTDPRDDMANLRRSEDEVLESYAWVDRNTGVVRIPIEQAMKLIAERGMPTR
jgi:hypothetical protein